MVLARVEEEEQWRVAYMMPVHCLPHWLLLLEPQPVVAQVVVEELLPLELRAIIHLSRILALVSFLKPGAVEAVGLATLMPVNPVLAEVEVEQQAQAQLEPVTRRGHQTLAGMVAALPSRVHHGLVELMVIR
jgi:hypothetical protein